MNTKKINIEFVRIFAILMTITIHISNIFISDFGKISDGYFLTSVIFNSLSRICVPLFFMISGAFAIGKEYSRKKYFYRIFKFILILIIWSCVYYIQKNGFALNNIDRVLLNSLFNADMTSRHLWYMYAIIGIYIALPFIQNMCKNLSKEQENLFLILWIILSGINVILVPCARAVTETNVENSYPIPIINATYYLGYFICGHILYKRFENTAFSNRKNAVCILIYIASTAVTAFFTYYISIKTNQLFDSMMWYKSLFTVFAALSVFVLIVTNEDKFKNTFITRLSKHTFGIYLIHIVFINIMKDNFDIIGYNPIIAIPAATIAIYLTSLISCIILSKIPFVKKIVF